MEPEFEKEEYAPEDIHPNPIEDEALDIKQENVLSNKTMDNPDIRGGSALIGSGNKSLRFNENEGLWLGNANFADAPFSVDMDGNIGGSSFSISNLSGDLDDIDDGTNYAKVAMIQLLVMMEFNYNIIQEIRELI